MTTQSFAQSAVTDLNDLAISTGDSLVTESDLQDMKEFDLIFRFVNDFSKAAAILAESNQ